MEDNTINTDNQEQNKDINSNQQVRKEEVELQDIHKEEETQEKPKRGNMFAKKDKRMQQIEELKASTEKLQAEKAELQDKFLRLYSEFDNYRKRTQKEKLDIIKTASENIILNLLPIIDDMERAIAFNEKNQTDDVSVKEGLTLILQKLKTMLKQKGLAEIKTENEPFSTDFHEAISTVPAERKKIKVKYWKKYKKDTP